MVLVLCIFVFFGAWQHLFSKLHSLSLYRKELGRDSEWSLYSSEEHCTSFGWESNGRILMKSELFVSVDINGEQKVFGFVEMLIKVTKRLSFYVVLWSQISMSLLFLFISLMLNMMWLLYHFHIRALRLALSAKDRTTWTPTSLFVLQSHSKFVRNFTQRSRTADVLLTI